ncbi:uncharacterized protein LOC125206814 [Salvia hispanica]|uniref:uncharacterized protein LOC125206814 n=1 Tax=Salvia hispanica TaxID=49212 RepID=UPI002009D123|nr:uncharacterized protein LOC125206814 [Salvia hispanica]
MVYREMQKVLRAYGEVLRLVRRLPEDSRPYYAKFARENFVNYREVDPKDAAAVQDLLRRTYNHSLWVLSKYGVDESVAGKLKESALLDRFGFCPPTLVEIGIPYTLEIMEDNNYFIWDIFQQYNQSDRKQVEVATVFIRQYDGAEAITYSEQVNVSALFLQGYQGNLKWEYTSILHHELTHVFQWDGEGKAPVGLVEGVADYMKLVSNYNQKGSASRGMGERWDQGYDFTARFLEYCEELRSGFVAALNKKMSSF